MLNFAEQTGSGAVMIVWSFLLLVVWLKYINLVTKLYNTTCTTGVLYILFPAKYELPDKLTIKLL